jgi:hypothetical protein
MFYPQMTQISSPFLAQHRQIAVWCTPSRLDREPRERERLDREPRERERLDREPRERERLDREPRERVRRARTRTCTGVAGFAVVRSYSRRSWSKWLGRPAHFPARTDRGLHG